MSEVLSVKKAFIIDTNVWLSDPDCWRKYAPEGDVVIPFKVLEEIDHFKTKMSSSVGKNSRQVIRFLDKLRENGDIQKGVVLGEGLGKLKVRKADNSMIPFSLDLTMPDNVILALALDMMKRGSKIVTVVTRDINMRVKCDSLNILVVNHILGKIVESKDSLFSGSSTLEISSVDIDEFWNGETLELTKEEHPGLMLNECLTLECPTDKKKKALARFVGYNKPLVKISANHKAVTKLGLTPRNREQTFALELLMDPTIPVVTLIGKAGCGKTLLAVAAGLAQIGLNKKKKISLKEGIDPAESVYTSMIISRPIQEMGQGLGFLPGPLEEKMAPFMQPIMDNMEVLLGPDSYELQSYMDSGLIKVEAPTYIRGRSIQKAFIIIDEAQNLSPHEIKTIITRVGEGTKIVLTGDIEQIDSEKLDETSNGLTYLVEKFKSYALSGHMTLSKGERSEVATLASQIL